MNTSFEFPKHFPVSGGKQIELRPPTAAEELELFEAGDANAARVEFDLAKRCIVSLDGLAVADVARDQVWEHELDGRARMWVRKWVGHCMGLGEAPPPFLARQPS